MIQGNDGRIRYVQVAVSIADPDKLAVFDRIRDNYPKYLLTMDDELA